MIVILLYSFLLLAGMIVSQVFDLTATKNILSLITTICLAYIMIEVGLEFTLDKKNLKSYAWDFAVAMTAAMFPWIFCAIYFLTFFEIGYKQAFLVGLFAAPTSAGILFAMLTAAGLGASWLFQKARVLAIADDLGTIFLLVCVKILLIGMQVQLVLILFIIGLLLITAYRWLHRFYFPTGSWWLISYSLLLVIFFAFLEHTTHIHLEILLPAFTLGCVIYNAPNHQKSLEPADLRSRILDQTIKGSFMFLVGCSLPKIQTGGLSLGIILVHVIVLTVLSNLGKCFAMLCYREEASVRERIALGVAMFPRGEVGAGILVVALGYQINSPAVTLSILSLALNLLLTGVFIAIVIKLIDKKNHTCPN